MPGIIPTAVDTWICKINKAPALMEMLVQSRRQRIKIAVNEHLEKRQIQINKEK